METWFQAFAFKWVNLYSYTEGFIAPPPFGILHMDSMKIYNSRIRVRV